MFYTESLTEGAMHPTLMRMTLPELLHRHGICTIHDFARRTKLSSQPAWHLGHGTVGLGRRTTQRLHAQLGIPAEELRQVAPPPPRSKARPPKRRPGEAS